MSLHLSLAVLCLLFMSLPLSAQGDRERSDQICEEVMKLLLEQHPMAASMGVSYGCTLMNTQPAEYWQCVLDAMKKGTPFDRAREPCLPKK